jgi:hypothetical protein
VVTINSNIVKKLLIFFLLIGLPVSFNAQTLVSYKKTESVDFSSYKTYKINKVNIQNTPEFEAKKEGINMLIFEINKQMSSRGYTVTTSDNADMLINLGIALQTVESKRETTLRDAPAYIGQRNYHWEAQEIVTYRYTEGTVIFDLVDIQNNELIWQAISRGTLSDKREKNKKKVVKAVEKLFKKFPVAGSDRKK